MSLRTEINEDYTDANGLVSPHPCSRQSTASDNGPMFTSEYYIMLKMRGELTAFDAMMYQTTINSCINLQGMLCRWPVLMPQIQEQIDDYYAVLNACKQLGITWMPRLFLKAAVRNLGALNNVNPGKWTFDSFLIRQPQLVASMVAAGFPSKLDPLHLAIRLIAFPFFLVAAVTIAISCIGEPKDSTDPRRLSWHLIQATQSLSVLCALSSLLWYRRLRLSYGIAGMRAVAAIYYKPEGSHPFAKYWVTR